MQIGLIGLPFCGKTTLFQTMTGVMLDPDQLHKRDARHGMVKVPDDRVERLAEIFKPHRVTHATIDFVDVIGLEKGDHSSTQFTTSFMNAVKNTDALIHVVRMFQDPVLPHPEGSIDPYRDVMIVETEFLLSDMGIVERRIDKVKKDIPKTGSVELKRELPVLERCLNHLEAEQSLRTLDLTREEAKMIRGYQLLTLKPMLVLLNLPETEVASAEKTVEDVRNRVAERGISVDAVFGKIEMEMAQLDEEEAEAFMSDYGIKESALKRIIRAAYDLLGLQSFLTAGEEECRAWTIRKGATAVEAAGEIHTDFYQKFIRAEVVTFEDLVKYGSYAACKEHGVWRLEGKEYVVRDGDVLIIRHG